MSRKPELPEKWDWKRPPGGSTEALGAIIGQMASRVDALIDHAKWMEDEHATLTANYSALLRGEVFTRRSEDSEKVHPFDCENCGNGERGNCPLPLSECSGKNDFARWVRPLTKPGEPTTRGVPVNSSIEKCPMCGSSEFRLDAVIDVPSLQPMIWHGCNKCHHAWTETAIEHLRQERTMSQRTAWCICAEPEIREEFCLKCGSPIKRSPFQEEPK